MSFEWLKNNLEFLVKPSVPFLSVVFACVSLIIVSPWNIRDVLGLEFFYQQYCPLLACLFLYSGFFLFYKVLVASGIKIKGTYAESQNKKKLMQKIQSLSPQEKALLKFLKKQDASVVWIPCDIPPMLALMNKSFLISAANGASMLRGDIYDRQQCFPVMINEIVNDLLREYPDLLPALALELDYINQIESVQYR